MYPIPEPTERNAELRHRASSAGCRSTNEYIAWLEARLIEESAWPPTPQMMLSNRAKAQMAFAQYVLNGKGQ